MEALRGLEICGLPSSSDHTGPAVSSSPELDPSVINTISIHSFNDYVLNVFSELHKALGIKQGTTPALLILTVYEDDSHLLIHKNVNMQL